MANEPSSTSNFVQIEDKVINKVVDASVVSNDVSLSDSVFIFKKNSDGQIDKVVNTSVQWLIDKFGEEAVQAKTDAISAKDAASASETNAKASETSASSSATKALASETNAKTSETNASTYAGQAKTSEENALSAAGRASASEENAKSSEIESKSSAESASSSAIIAGQKADEAASSASDASSSASSAAESKADATSAKEGAIAAKNSAESLKNEMQQSFDTAIEQAISAISLKLHPIGSYFISDKEDNPGSLFGGTWESVRDVMLIGAGNKYVAGSTGGNDTHTLSKDEMPSHNHGEAGAHAHSRGTMNITGWINIPKANNEDTASSGALYSSGGSVKGNAALWDGTCLRVNLDASKSWTGSTSSNGSHTHSTEGSSKPFSILNPYRAVYIWRRIA